MAIPIKSAQEIGEKFARVASQRTQEYAAGVQNPGKSWAKETSDAAPRYEEGIQKSITEKRFDKGVAKAGDAKWQEAAVTKGVQRWAPGIAGSAGAYAEGFAPFQSVIAGLSLPPRFPRGDERNLLRVATVANALHKKKVQG